MIKILYVFLIFISGLGQCLDSLIEMSIQKNPILKSFDYRIRATEKRAESVSYLSDPILQAVYFPKEIVTANGPQVAQLSFVQKFPWFGTLSLKEEIVRKTSESISERRKQKQIDIIYTISENYFRLASLQLKDILLHNYSELLEGFYQSALSRYENGNGLQQNVLKMQTEMSMIKNRRILLKSMIRKRISKINQIGYLSLSNINASFPIQFNQLNKPTSLENHTVKSLVKMKEQIELKRDLTNYKALPNISLGFKYNIIAEKAGVSGNQDAFGFSLGVTLPIFSGKYENEEEAYILESSSIQQEILSKQNEIRERISFFEYDIREQKRSLKLLQKDLIPKAQLTLKSAIIAYETGTIGFLGLLDAQRVLFDLQFQEVDAQKRYHISVSAYKKETTVLKDGDK